MSSGGKSGSQQKSINYYGSIYGAIAWRLDWFKALISNGNYIWQCSSSGPVMLRNPGVLNANGYLDLTGGILDPSLLMEDSYVRLYPSAANAVADGAIPGHPDYPDCAYLAAKHIFVGQNSGTAPNWQIIGGAQPVVPSSIVDPADNIVDDFQVNPIAYLAEFLLDERGKGFPLSILDSASWLSSGHWCAQDTAHRAYSFISPLVADQTPLRDVVKLCLDHISGFLRWTPDGKLGCFIYEWGVDPGGLVTLDARYFTNNKRPKIKDGDWKDVPTETVVSFTDRGYEFQTNTVRVPNARAIQIRQVDDPTQLDRKHVTRSAQAFSHGQENNRRLGMAPGTATVSVRGPIVANLLPGDKVKLDEDPEPGGVGSAVLGRIDKIQIDRTDEVTLDLTLDPLLPAVAYTPSWISPLPESLFAGAVETAPSLVHLLAIPLPFDFSGWPPAVGFLATRPSPLITGFHAYFTSNPATAFSELGRQYGFAARCQLVSTVAAGAGTLRLQLLDGATGPDAYIAGDTPGGNVAQAQDNYLLAILVSLDGSGRVALDGGGQPIMEFCSILQRSAVTSDTHDYTVYRGRAGTTAVGWGSGAIAWIIRSQDLTVFTHQQFAVMFGATAYFRLASFTGAAVDESSPLPETDMVWPSVPVPNSLVATPGTGKEISLNWLGSSVFSDSGEYAVYRATGPGYTDWAKIGEVRATRFTDHEVALGTTYQYKIAAVTENELVSSYSNVVTITVPSVLSSDIDQTPPTDATAATKVGEGTYIAGDGSVHSYLMIRVPILPGAGSGTVAATEQDVRYRLSGTGATGWTIQDQPENFAADGTKDIRIDDLPPGSLIDVITRTYSRFGIPAIHDIPATGSPFTAPVKTALPTAPSGNTFTAGNSIGYAGPQLMSGDVRLACCRATWSISPDLDFKSFEYIRVSFGATPAPTDTGIMTRLPDIFLGSNLLFVEHLWVRAWDTSNNKSAWVDFGSFASYLAYVSGDLVQQSASSTELSGFQVGQGGAGSITQTLAIFDDTVVQNLVGGTSETFTVSLSGCGFTTKPTIGSVTCDDPPNDVDACYSASDPANSSTQAVISVSKAGGYSGGYRRFSITLKQLS